MRNVTIVESNVEPNKEHLWFYNGKLKWFGPNGWEEIYSQASSPTTTPKPVVPPTTTTTTTTTTSTPEPTVLTTPFGVRIYNNLADKVDITVTEAEVANKSIEPNGATTFKILPNSRGGFFSLRVQSVNLHDTVDAIRVAILGKMGDDTINQNIIIDNGNDCTIEYSASAALSTIDLNIQLYKYDATSGTTSTPQPDTTTTTSSTTTRPPNGSGREIQVYAGYGIAHPLSILMTSKDTLDDGLMAMEDKFYPEEDEYNLAYYSTSGKYLAVAYSTEAKVTIVASIDVDRGPEKHTLYPKDTGISGYTGHRFFLFDLSESPGLESTYDGYITYIKLSAYTPDTISTIAPFIDGNIPPFADEK